MMIGLIITGRKKDDEATEKKEVGKSVTTLANLVNENSTNDFPGKDGEVPD